MPSATGSHGGGSPSTQPVPVSTSSTSTSSLSQSSSRSTQSAHGSRTLPGITSSEARASSPYYPAAQLSSASSARNLLQMQGSGLAFTASGSSSSSQSGRPRQGFMSSQPFTSQPQLTHPQWPPQLHQQPLGQDLEPVGLQQTRSQNIPQSSTYSPQISRPTLDLRHVYAEDQQAHDPILHYEQYILGGQRPGDFREADQGGQGLDMSSSVHQSQIGPVVNYPSTAPNPQYIELSYEQIFDQPGELQSTFPETVSPSGGSPLDPFPDDPPPHG
jgi:hypothetical protein